MKIGKLAVFAAALFVATSAANAQREREVTWDVRERFAYDSAEGDRFFANEFSLDLFGSWMRPHDDVEDFFKDDDNDVWGAGIGLNYFITRHFGLGVNAAWHDNSGAFVDHVMTDVILRVPIDAISMAPYVFGGAGRVFDPSDLWEAHAGVGIEFRLNEFTGIFADGRYMWVEDGGDGSQVRAGLRFAF